MGIVVAVPLACTEKQKTQRLDHYEQDRAGLYLIIVDDSDTMGTRYQPSIIEAENTIVFRTVSIYLTF